MAGRTGATRPIRPAFSLTELLIVLAILGLLTAVVAPTILRGIELTRRAVCQGNLRNLTSAFHMKRADVADGTTTPMAVTTHWPIYLVDYMGDSYRGLLCPNDDSPVASFEGVEIYRTGGGGVVYDLNVFDSHPIWEECSMADLEGNPPGVWKLNEAQYEAIEHQESLNIIGQLPQYDPGENPNVYYYMVEDLRTGDPNGENWGTGDCDYEDIIIRVEERGNNITLDFTFGYTVFNFDLTTPAASYTQIKGQMPSLQFKALGENSYGMNWHADNVLPGAEVILALDYEDDVVYVGSDHEKMRWEQYNAPRHLGQSNVSFTDGGVTAMDVEDIAPLTVETRNEYWNTPSTME